MWVGVKLTSGQFRGDTRNRDIASMGERFQRSQGYFGVEDSSFSSEGVTMANGRQGMVTMELPS